MDYVVAPQIPRGLAPAVEGLAREILRQRPRDIYAFAAHHFEKLVKLRDKERAIGIVSKMLDYKSYEEGDRVFDWIMLNKTDFDVGEYNVLRKVKKKKRTKDESGWSINRTAKVLERYKIDIAKDETRLDSTKDDRLLKREGSLKRQKSADQIEGVRSNFDSRNENIARRRSRSLALIEDGNGRRVRNIRKELRREKEEESRSNILESIIPSATSIIFPLVVKRSSAGKYDSRSNEVDEQCANFTLPPISPDDTLKSVKEESDSTILPLISNGNGADARLSSNEQRDRYDPEHIHVVSTDGDSNDERPEIAIKDEQPEDTVEEHQPEVAIKDEQPEDIVEKEQSKVSIKGEQPEVTIKDEQSEIVIKNEQPEVTVEKEQPEVAIKDEQPEDTVEEEQPEVAIKDEQPEDTVEKESEVAVKDAQPEDAIENEQPEDTVEKEQPEVAVKYEQLEDAIKNEQPEDTVEKEQPEVAIKDEQPEDAIKNEQPEDTVEKEQPEIAIKDEQPEVAIKNEQSEVTVEKERLEIAIRNEQPEAAIKNKQSEVAIKNNQPEVMIESEQPEFAIKNVQPEVAIKNEQPEIAIKNEQPEITIHDEQLSKSQSSIQSYENRIIDNGATEYLSNLQVVEETFQDSLNVTPDPSDRREDSLEQVENERNEEQEPNELKRKLLEIETVEKSIENTLASSRASTSSDRGFEQPQDFSIPNESPCNVNNSTPNESLNSRIPLSDPFCYILSTEDDSPCKIPETVTTVVIPDKTSNESLTQYFTDDVETHEFEEEHTDPFGEYIDPEEYRIGNTIEYDRMFAHQDLGNIKEEEENDVKNGRTESEVQTTFNDQEETNRMSPVVSIPLSASEEERIIDSVDEITSEIEKSNSQESGKNDSRRIEEEIARELIENFICDSVDAQETVTEVDEVKNIQKDDEVTKEEEDVQARDQKEHVTTEKISSLRHTGEFHDTIPLPLVEISKSTNHLVDIQSKSDESTPQVTIPCAIDLLEIYRSPDDNTEFALNVTPFVIRLARDHVFTEDNSNDKIIAPKTDASLDSVTDDLREPLALDDTPKCVVIEEILDEENEKQT